MVRELVVAKRAGIELHHRWGLGRGKNGTDSLFCCWFRW